MELETGGLEGSVFRRVQTDLGRWHWENLRLPAGMRTDEKGNLYVAAKYLYVYSPRGELLKDIRLSETPSNLAFGDPDFSTLYVTARNAVYRIRLGVKGALQYAPQVP